MSVSDVESARTSHEHLPRALKLRPPPHKHKSSWFTPTHLHFVDADGNDVEWQSRRQRKHRYAPQRIALTHEGRTVEPWLRLPSVQIKPHVKADVSLWICVLFTVGSVIWVICGVLAWLPKLHPSLESNEEIETAGAGVGFIGGILYEVGAYFMVVEALDRGREQEFGTAMWQVMRPHQLKKRLEDDVHAHEEKHAEKKSGSPPPAVDATTGKLYYNSSGTHAYPRGPQGWVWWGKPMWHDMGYCAAMVMFIGASFFWICTLTALPGVIPGMADGKQVAVTDIFYWVPQVIGGVCFVVAALLLLLEVQPYWWQPRPLDIGWQVAFWNLIGGVGFLLCPCFGFSSSHGMQYQSTLATLWGSCAFLIGSTCQLFETIFREVPPPKDKH